MRGRGPAVSQVLRAFAVLGVLIAAGAAVGYLALWRQDSAVSQLTARFHVLQRTARSAQEEFSTSQTAATDYALTGRGELRPLLRGQQRAFTADLETLRALSPASLRGLVAVQARTGAQLFTVAGKIVWLSPHSSASLALASGLAVIARDFSGANRGMQNAVAGKAWQLTQLGKHDLSVGLAWSAAAITIAVLLLLAASLGTLCAVTRPLRALAAIMRQRNAGDRAARMLLAGSAEVREVAQCINMQADESDQLRAQESESNRLRALAREAGLRIREHLVADDVLREAQLALEQSVDAEILSLRLLHEGRLGPRVGDGRGRALLTDDAVLQVPPQVLKQLQHMFEAQTSGIMQNLHGRRAAQLARNLTPPVYQALLRAGVVSMLITPFGVGSEVLGIVVAQRLHYNHRWTPAEIDAVESIAADLGRGLNQARLYEAENRLVAELKALDEAKSDFFATVSHELRAPLTTIEGYVEMLADGEAGPVPAQQRTMLAAIDRSAGRLRSLIDDVFTLAKLESGAQHTLMRPVSIAEIIEAAVESVQPSAAAAKLTLTARVPQQEMTVEADAGQLERVLINLLSNAVKFTPEGGHVTVTATVEGPAAVVSVADTGIGIPEHEQKDLFTRFFRASNAREAAIPGTGLGLAIVRTIMASHGGEVGLDSREGSGTTVALRLPFRVTAMS